MKTDNRRSTGAAYEQAAGYYLEQLGYEILEYNYRCRRGEIDIVAKDGEYLGNAHRWQKNQVHEISETEAAPGFVTPRRLAGSWEGMIHLHAVCTPRCQGQLIIEGRVSDALVSC